MKKPKTENKTKLTLKTLIEDSQKLDSLCKISFPMKTAYWLQRILSRVKSEIADFNVVRENLIKELGQKDENGEFRVKDENLEDFYAKLKELQAVEVDLGFDKIDLSSLGNSMNIQPELLLDWVFTFEE